MENNPMNTEITETEVIADLTGENALPINYEEAIEAILFAAGHPVTYEQLSKTFGIPLYELKEIVYAYAAKYNNPSIPRGVTLLTLDTCCQLCTKAEYIAPIRAALGIRKSSGTLSASTIEALTIVAYQQPVTRAYVDAVRNADSSYAMSNLLDRGLIEPKGRKDVPGRPILYGTTSAFLRCFGLSSLDELPGNTGEAQSIFRSINDRLHLEDAGEGEQLTIDEFMSTTTDLQDEVPGEQYEETAEQLVEEVQITEGDVETEDDWGNATEEAERIAD